VHASAFLHAQLVFYSLLGKSKGLLIIEIEMYVKGEKIIERGRDKAKAFQ